jgi:hypothetical protein
MSRMMLGSFVKRKWIEGFDELLGLLGETRQLDSTLARKLGFAKNQVVWVWQYSSDAILEFAGLVPETNVVSRKLNCNGATEALLLLVSDEEVWYAFRVESSDQSLLGLYRRLLVAAQAS